MSNTQLDQKINEEDINKECLTLHLKDMLANYIGSILIGLPIFIFIFQSHASKTATQIWFTFDVILMVSVIFTYYGFYWHNKIFDLITWKKISQIPLIIFSLNIALAPWLFLQTNVGIYLYTMLIMIIALIGNNIYSISFYWKRLVIFSFFPFLSLFIKLYTMDIENTVEIYVVLIVVWAGLLSFGHRAHTTLMHSIILKFEHIQARTNAERINAEKSQFIAAASHDIRQPLQAINLLVSTLKSNNTNPNDGLLFERLENSVDSMSELLNSLLDVSKLDAHAIVPMPQHLCLKTILEKLHGELTPFANAKGIKFEVETEDIFVFADIILLEQILNNLLSNAIRYTNTGSIFLSAKNDSGQIKISVKDTGIGIASINQESIFLEFHQLNNPERDQNKGIGLGLSIVRRLCALQGWPLSLESELDVGSCFSFKVNKGNKELIQKNNIVDMNKNLGAIDVIVIDDNEGIRFSLSNVLTSWGCKVRSFESADQVCESLKQLPNWKPNFIISDYRLRNNISGVDAINKVKTKLNYSIEAILISGDTAPEEIKKVEESGLIMLHKPIKPAKLRVLITQKMNAIINFAPRT